MLVLLFQSTVTGYTFVYDRAQLVAQLLDGKTYYCVKFDTLLCNNETGPFAGCARRKQIFHYTDGLTRLYLSSLSKKETVGYWLPCGVDMLRNMVLIQHSSLVDASSP